MLRGNVCPHGAFLPWIEAEFGMAERTARNFMKVAEKYAGKSAIVADLQPTALYALATSEPEVREEVERLIAAGEVVTKAKIRNLEVTPSVLAAVAPPGLLPAVPSPSCHP